MNVEEFPTRSELTREELEKTEKDLDFIKSTTEICKDNNARLIVSGGYSIDGNLGKITRPHRDLDILIFGQDDRPVEFVDSLFGQLNASTLELEDKGRKTFYHWFFAEGGGQGIDIYYIQVKGDPFAKEKVVIKSDGSETEIQQYNTRKVSLGGIDFEAQDPEDSLSDILMKRERGERQRLEHDQDIMNLKQLLEK